MTDITETLEDVPPDVLRAFLARELAADPDLEQRFHSFLDTSDLDVYELRDEIESRNASNDDIGSGSSGSSAGQSWRRRRLNVLNVSPQASHSWGIVRGHLDMRGGDPSMLGASLEESYAWRRRHSM